VFVVVAIALGDVGVVDVMDGGADEDDVSGRGVSVGERDIRQLVVRDASITALPLLAPTEMLMELSLDEDREDEDWPNAMDLAKPSTCLFFFTVVTNLMRCWMACTI
jgi:hypothetical protein